MQLACSCSCCCSFLYTFTVLLPLENNLLTTKRLKLTEKTFPTNSLKLKQYKFIKKFQNANPPRYRSGHKARGSPLHPIDEEFLAVLREARQKEVEMWAIVREIVSYFIFIVIVYLVSETFIQYLWEKECFGTALKFSFDLYSHKL